MTAASQGKPLYNVVAALLPAGHGVGQTQSISGPERHYTFYVHDGAW